MIDHAAAHERIADLALEPGGLDRALGDGQEIDRELADHVATCERCTADVATWRGVQGTLTSALRRTAAGQRSDLEPIEASAELRRRVTTAAAAEPRKPAADRPGSKPLFVIPGGGIGSTVVGLAAALIVAVAGTLLLAGPATNVMRTIDEARGLTEVVAAVDRILTADRHVTVALQATDGSAAGTVSWTRHDLVVLTSALTTPATGSTYRCWLVGDGQDTSIGAMEFAGGTAYWVGSLDDWASISFAPGTRFLVTLENGPAGSTRTGPTVLQTTF
jgi:hypothetical protein